MDILNLRRLPVHVQHSSSAVIFSTDPRQSMRRLSSPRNWARRNLIFTSQESSPAGQFKKFGPGNEVKSIRDGAAIGAVSRPRDRLFDPASSVDQDLVIEALQVPRSRSERVPLHQLRQGGFVEDLERLLYRQVFVVRSYEVGADKDTSITTIFSFLQEVSLCHVHLMGIAGDGFGATKAMNRLGLIWVVTKMHVEVDQFPKWPDVIEIDSWIARAGKNGMRRDWIVRRSGTNEVLVRATSTWCMVNSTTRRVCKMPEAARAELDPFFMDDRFVFQQRDILSNKITKLDNHTAKHLSPPLMSCRADLDVNQHVSNLKYVSWALQSVPEEHQETHNLTSISLEYRRECQSNNIVESLTGSKTTLHPGAATSAVPAEGFWHLFVNCGPAPSCQYTHLLRTTQDSRQHEIVRALTTWRLRRTT